MLLPSYNPSSGYYSWLYQFHVVWNTIMVLPMYHFEQYRFRWSASIRIIFYETKIYYIPKYKVPAFYFYCYLDDNSFIRLSSMYQSMLYQFSVRAIIEVHSILQDDKTYVFLNILNYHVNFKFTLFTVCHQFSILLACVFWTYSIAITESACRISCWLQ